MSRIFMALLVAIFALICSNAGAQSVCPNQEILIFGSAYGYTTSVCAKNGKECGQSASSTIVFFPNKVTKAGCAKAPNCDSCATKLPASNGKSKGNFVYGGRQIFLDTTNGVSQIDNLQFAMVPGDKSDTHYAIFEVSVVYSLEGKKPVYFACPIAIQLPGDPGIPDPLEGASKSVEGETRLVVKDGEKERGFKIVEAQGNMGVVKTKLLRTLDKNPIPADTNASAKPSVPTPAKPKRPTPVEDK